MNRKIGFACKYIDHEHQVNGIKPSDDCKKYNLKTTTLSWLNNQQKDVAEQRLWDLIKYNLDATLLLVKKVSEFEPSLRMVRLGSEILPVYTAKHWSKFYDNNDVIDYCADHFKLIGDYARQNGVRLSFHPGQFCVLASDNPQTVANSIDEFEYHADMAYWMGYGCKFQDFKINVHLSGANKASGFLKAYKQLSTVARRCITIENDEISSGLQDVLKIADVCPIVLDIHHHFIHSRGEYIEPNSKLVDDVIASWCGVRPTIHYSLSRNELVNNKGLPNFNKMVASGHKIQQLRAHSDFMWNRHANAWALSHWEYADIMVEAKAKNLASFNLYKQAQEKI